MAAAEKDSQDEAAGQCRYATRLVRFKEKLVAFIAMRRSCCRQIAPV
jgi:hypothetical protein